MYYANVDIIYDTVSSLISPPMLNRGKLKYIYKPFRMTIEGNSERGGGYNFLWEHKEALYYKGCHLNFECSLFNNSY